jgi:Zn-dependent peptidase ImmA (M78 family)
MSIRLAIKKAKEIRKRYEVDDLELLALRLGAEVIEYPLGRIIKEAYFKDLGVIVIDPHLHPYKKRHLIAHGLAHHLLHRDRKANYFLEGEDLLKDLELKMQEKEAEAFAAHLLIPEEKLEEILKEEWIKGSADPIRELSEEFQVSENFMRKRLELKEKN